MNIDIIYHDLLRKILTEGKVKTNRTKVTTTSISGAMIEYDMADGFPLLTTKKMAWKTLRVELEGFIKGITDKRWFQERGCKIWNEWCSPKKVPYANDDVTCARMAAEPDLGPIYGFQWRNFNGNYNGPEARISDDPSLLSGVDQLKWAIEQVKNNPNSRRIIVSAWNPQQLDQMALVPCHYAFQLLVNGDQLDLLWNQRSCDTFLGIPFNIASYALLLELIAHECGLKANKLIGFLGDVHVYHNHMEQIQAQLEREPYPAPKLILGGHESIFDWEWSDATLDGYQSHGALPGAIAV